MGKPEAIAKGGHPLDSGEKVWALSLERDIFSASHNICYVLQEEMLHYKNC